MPNPQALLEYLKQEDPHYDARVEFFSRSDLQDLTLEEKDNHPDCPPRWNDQWAHFQLDMSPFEVIQFKEDEQGLTDFKQAVVDLGFVLSEQEEEMWDEFIGRYKEEE